MQAAPHLTGTRQVELSGEVSPGRCGRHRQQGLDPWPLAHRPLAFLPALELKDPLHRVHCEQPGELPATERRLLFDQGLGRDTRP